MSVMRLNSDPAMPTVWTFYEWLLAHPQLDKAYSRAREIQADLQAAELEKWSDEVLVGTKTIRRTKHTAVGTEVTEETHTYDNIERARLKVATRQWLLGKLRPRKYGVQPTEPESGDALQDLLGEFRKRNDEIANAQ